MKANSPATGGRMAAPDLRVACRLSGELRSGGSDADEGQDRGDPAGCRDQSSEPIWPVTDVEIHRRKAGFSVMKKHPKRRLSRLMDIGWRCWDPIGFAGLDCGWKNIISADEYTTATC